MPFRVRQSTHLRRIVVSAVSDEADREVNLGFPESFVWGAAAASYQIEGSFQADNKGLSVWDMFTRKGRSVFEGHTGDVACDHYRRCLDDVALMSGMGLQAYRFSVSWPRILPTGTKTLNQAGLDFYERLVDALLERQIVPYLTLFHWDYPIELYYKGGWLNPDSADWFADYAAVIAGRFGDRVRHFITLNEPQVFIGMGHQEGTHAPGETLALSEVLQAGHHVLLAHGKAVQAIRAVASQAQVGFAPVMMPRVPASASAADVEAARRATFAVDRRNCWTHSWWLDPVLLGRYPEDGLQLYGADAPRIATNDFEIISQPVDFLGLNTYQGVLVESDQQGAYREVELPPGYPRTAFNWPITPEALYWGPKFCAERYQLPLVITENGVSVRDWVAVDGAVHDHARIDFCTRYIRQLARAIEHGADVRGYFLWSIMDNFEWAEGYKERFGLIHIDYQTQKRTLKDSAHWYREVIASNGRAVLVQGADAAQATDA